MILQDISN